MLSRILAPSVGAAVRDRGEPAVHASEFNDLVAKRRTVIADRHVPNRQNDNVGGLAAS
jgi:hypothetical protein